MSFNTTLPNVTVSILLFCTFILVVTGSSDSVDTALPTVKPAKSSIPAFVTETVFSFDNVKVLPDIL